MGGLTDNSGNMVMPVGPMMGNGGGFGYGGFGDGLFWIIVLFLFAFMGNNFGGFGGGYGNGAMPFLMNTNTNNDVQRGFDQQAVIGGINGINASINSLAQGQCAAFANAEIAANARLTALDSRLDAIAMAQQQCCCENRQAVSDVKYTVAQENAATRANTDAKVQMVMDKLCQLELDGVRQNYENRISGMQNEIDALRSQVNDARWDASQTAQTANIVRQLNPAPIPAYYVQNPSGCGCSNGCSGNWT